MTGYLVAGFLKHYIEGEASFLPIIRIYYSKAVSDREIGMIKEDCMLMKTKNYTYHYRDALIRDLYESVLTHTFYCEANNHV